MKKVLCFICLLGFAATAGANSGDVLFETNFGDIVIDLYPEQAEITVANFIGYVEEDFYDGLTFHRIAEDPAVIQAGAYDTEGIFRTPTSGPIVNESNNGLSNVQYTVAMARGLASNSATSQFYINTADNLFLDYVNPSNPQYCVFGEVVSGMNVVDAIANVTTTQGETPDDPVIITNATVIPEPATILLLGFGCLALVRKRKR